mmetsp:Transcript_3246/g.6317  ORF Transcript_3246/g.6317 Transcript_3246/m.6317 type:complete len:273 (-) Transcript_3246:1784-2602(-)
MASQQGKREHSKRMLLRTINAKCYDEKRTAAFYKDCMLMRHWVEETSRFKYLFFMHLYDKPSTSTSAKRGRKPSSLSKGGTKELKPEPTEQNIALRFQLPRGAGREPVPDDAGNEYSGAQLLFYAKNLDKVVEKLQEQQFILRVPPTEVYGVRVASTRDPNGFNVRIVEGTRSRLISSTEPTPLPGPLRFGYATLACIDADKTSSFYERLFSTVKEFDSSRLATLTRSKGDTAGAVEINRDGFCIVDRESFPEDQVDCIWMANGLFFDLVFA